MEPELSSLDTERLSEATGASGKSTALVIGALGTVILGNFGTQLYRECKGLRPDRAGLDHQICETLSIQPAR